MFWISWISSFKQNCNNFKKNFRKVQIPQFRTRGFVVFLCKKAFLILNTSLCSFKSKNLYEQKIDICYFKKQWKVHCQFSKALYSFCNLSCKPQSSWYNTYFSLSIERCSLNNMILSSLLGWHNGFLRKTFPKCFIFSSSSSFCFFISFTSSSFNFLFFSLSYLSLLLSDFCTSPFLLFWARVCV